jgi:hypothetical protein
MVVTCFHEDNTFFGGCFFGVWFRRGLRTSVANANPYWERLEYADTNKDGYAPSSVTYAN